MGCGLRVTGTIVTSPAGQYDARQCAAVFDALASRICRESWASDSFNADLGPETWLRQVPPRIAVCHALVQSQQAAVWSN